MNAAVHVQPALFVIPPGQGSLGNQGPTLGSAFRADIQLDILSSKPQATLIQRPRPANPGRGRHLPRIQNQLGHNPPELFERLLPLSDRLSFGDPPSGSIGERRFPGNGKCPKQVH